MSGLQKNVAGQRWMVFAFNRKNGDPELVDAANITAKIRIDYGGATATNDVNPTEIEDGYYEFTLTQAETDGDVLDILPESSTTNISVIGVPGRIFTVPPAFADDMTQAGISDAVWDEVLTSGTHNVGDSAGRRIRAIEESGGYEDGAVWIASGGTSGQTEDYENGTVHNPVDNITDANLIAGSINLSRFRITPGTTVTLAAAQNNQTFIGDGWTLVLAGQDIAGSTFIGATVSGIGAGTGTIQTYKNCILNTVTHVKGTHLLECAIANTQTIAEAGDYFADRCHSAVAGAATPIWDFGAAITASNLNFRNYSGGIEIQNMGTNAGTYEMSLEGRGQLIINANCSATSNIHIRGLFDLTNNASGITIEDTARYEVDQILQRQITETYNADGTPPTVEEALMGIYQCLTEFEIIGTTITVKQLDGSTTALTFNLDDSADPTSRTRAT